MNDISAEELLVIHDLRNQLLDAITDEQLAYKLPGDNPTLGELCVEMGQIEQVYTHSFRTFRQDWKHRESEPTAVSVEGLRVWYNRLDVDMSETLQTLSENDVQTRRIDRGQGFTPTAPVQFQVYREAVLIFCAKASVYLKALQRPVTDQWQHWIG